MSSSTNKNLAEIFYEIADFLEMEGVPFKPYAYQKAGLSLETLEEDIREIFKKEGVKAIEKIPGIGKSIAQKIVEFLETGKIKYYEQYKKKYPINIKELTAIEGIGPKMVRDLYKLLGIKNLKELEKAAKEGKIRDLPNFGKKTEENILESIKFLKRSQGRFLLGEILPRVREIIKYLSSQKGVTKIELAGSVRRRKETIGDVDILVVAKNPEKIMERFCSMEGILKIWGKGKTKSSLRLKEGFDVDLRVVLADSFGSALQYFTGSKEHNIQLRKIALTFGYKLNEYGLFKGKKKIAGAQEKEIYQKLKMAWPPPELRENRGEIEAALEKRLPKLIELADIKGDLHCHSKWDGGADSIEELAREGIKRGYQYLGISDHTKFLKIEHGLTESKLLAQRKVIDKLNEKFKNEGINFRILQGAETNILPDGSLDIKGEVLKKLDYVIAGVHSAFKMTKEQMTKRVIKAMENPFVKIISHPTGRLIKKRDPYQLDLEKIFQTAKKTNTILEVNSFPERLDLNDIYIKEAIKRGIKIIINTDAHRKDQLRYMEYGVFQARRGWAEKKDVINTKELFELLEFFKKNGKRR